MTAVGESAETPLPRPVGVAVRADPAVGLGAAHRADFLRLGFKPLLGKQIKRHPHCREGSNRNNNLGHISPLSLASRLMTANPSIIGGDSGCPVQANAA